MTSAAEPIMSDAKQKQPTRARITSGPEPIMLRHFFQIVQTRSSCLPEAKGGKGKCKPCLIVIVSDAAQLRYILDLLLFHRVYLTDQVIVNILFCSNEPWNDLSSSCRLPRPCTEGKQSSSSSGSQISPILEAQCVAIENSVRSKTSLLYSSRVPVRMEFAARAMARGGCDNADTSWNQILSCATDSFSLRYHVVHTIINQMLSDSMSIPVGLLATHPSSFIPHASWLGGHDRPHLYLREPAGLPCSVHAHHGNDSWITESLIWTSGTDQPWFVTCICLPSIQLKC